MEAQLWRSVLESEGIKTQVLDQHLGSVAPHFFGNQGIRLAVENDRDEKIALEILKDLQQEGSEES
jgi:hypothetical protein